MKVIGLTVLAKLAVFGVILLGSFFFQFQTQYFNTNFICHRDEAPGLSTRFTTWDAQYYLFLAEKSYAAEPTSHGFYPLFPFLIRVFNFMFLNHTWMTGLFLSTVLTVIAMVYFFRLTEKLYDEEIAWTACVLLLAFPTSFFIGLVYSESIFLALAAAFFYYSEEKKEIPGMVCAFLLPFSRPVGILILIPALAAMAINRKKEGVGFRGFLIPLSLIAGFLGYLCLMNLETGNPFAAFVSQARFPGNNSVGNLFHPIDWIWNNFITGNFTLNQMGRGLLDRLAFVGFLTVIFLGWRRLNLPLLVYALALGLVGLLSINLWGYIRYVVVVFPLFILAALKLKGNREYYLAFCLPLQMFFVLLYSLDYWVA